MKGYKMKCVIHTGNKEQGGGVIVRRKFVPIQFKIERANQFINASAKLPFTSAKIVGVLTTSKVSSCNKDPFPNMYYYGVTGTEMTNTRFLENTAGNTYDSDYPPDTFIEGNPGDWWFFVHPVIDETPYYITESVGYQRLRDPILIEIKHQGQCTPDQYYLWSEQITDRGTTWVVFSPDS